MAFTGAAVFEVVADGLVRITGLSLANGGVSGVIGLAGSGLEVELPEQFQPSDYADVTLSESVQVSIQRSSNEANAMVIQVVKADGPPFSITLTNNDAANASGALEIYVRFH
jgi:hypothetical protein